MRKSEILETNRFPDELPIDFVTASFRNADSYNPFYIHFQSPGVDMSCTINNARGFLADPPKVGDRLRLIVRCGGYDPDFKRVSFLGIYVSRA